MMVLTLLCYLAHCWHRILLLFHFGRMCRSRNQNCYCKCYCNRKIFHFGRMLSWKYHCCHWSPHAQFEFPCTVDVPQVCLHHFETHVLTGAGTSPCFRECFSLGGCAGLGSYNIFGYFTVYFTLGGCFGLWNEQCYWWWCHHSFELGTWPNGTVGRVSSDWWLSLGLTTDRSPLRSWFKSLSALACYNSTGISKSG